MPGTEQAAFAVHIDCAAFEGKIDALVLRRPEYTGGAELFDQRVIPSSLELAAPSGKTEVQQA